LQYARIAYAIDRAKAVPVGWIEVSIERSSWVKRKVCRSKVVYAGEVQVRINTTELRVVKDIEGVNT
jgi:hypothetical protein